MTVRAVLIEHEAVPDLANEIFQVIRTLPRCLGKVFKGRILKIRILSRQIEERRASLAGYH